VFIFRGALVKLLFWARVRVSVRLRVRVTVRVRVRVELGLVLGLGLWKGVSPLHWSGIWGGG